MKIHCSGPIDRWYIK